MKYQRAWLIGLLILVCPIVVNAAWWNPLSWTWNPFAWFGEVATVVSQPGIPAIDHNSVSVASSSSENSNAVQSNTTTNNNSVAQVSLTPISQTITQINPPAPQVESIAPSSTPPTPLASSSTAADDSVAFASSTSDTGCGPTCPKNVTPSTTVTQSIPPWLNRTDFGAAVQNNRIFIMGGESPNGTLLDDVWSTPDAVSWSKVNSAVPWPERIDFDVEQQNNRMLILGGKDANGMLLKDAWTSEDGVSWSKINSNIPWAERTDFEGTTLNNVIFIMGGAEY